MTKFVSEERMRPLIQNPSPLCIIIPSAAEPAFKQLTRSLNESQQILPKNALFTTIYQRLNENEYEIKNECIRKYLLLYLYCFYFIFYFIFKYTINI
jgi:hypothetical protein